MKNEQLHTWCKQYELPFKEETASASLALSKILEKMDEVSYLWSVILISLLHTDSEIYIIYQISVNPKY